MRVLLDECLPRKLKLEFRGHDVVTVPEMGWSGIKNGPLLQLASGQFDVFVTIDRGISYQQNLAALVIAVVILAAKSNRLGDLVPLMPRVQTVLQTIRPGEVMRVGS